MPRMAAASYSYMNAKLDRPGPFNARMTNGLFVAYNQYHFRHFLQCRMKILFSDKVDWIRPIRRGFKFSRHEIVFKDISIENIRDYDMVVPLTVRDLLYLNEVRDLVAHNPIPIPSTESIRLCDDKYLLNRALIANGFGETVPGMDSPMAYPYILKKKIDEWGKHSHIISGAGQERDFSDKLADADYFMQEFIHGPDEYATHIIFKGRRVVCSVNIQYMFETGTPIKGKDRNLYSRICRCPYLGLFSSILGSIDFEGLCCINYKVRENRPFILEINPRFGGSLGPYFASFMKHIA
jgi:predicted ATP-grasp superfamily ATP-dependent carboligase